MINAPSIINTTLKPSKFGIMYKKETMVLSRGLKKNDTYSFLHHYYTLYFVSFLLYLSTVPPQPALPLLPIMLCKVCIDGLQGIWDPKKTERVCLMKDFQKDTSPMEDSKFVTYVETDRTAEQLDPKPLDPENYVFGHHRTQESFENSIRNGCVMCQIFKPRPEDTQTKSDSNIATYGYYSLFSITFQDCPIMSLYVNDDSGGFELWRHSTFSAILLDSCRFSFSNFTLTRLR